MISPEQFADQLRRAIEIIKENDPPLRIASYDTLGKQSLRIFTEGKNSSGGAIGQYNSTEPLYLNPKTSEGSFKVGGKPNDKGKRSRKKVSVQKFAGFSKNSLKDVGKKTKVDRKTRWFASYKDYRAEIGRESGFVNLDLGGELKLDMENPQSGVPTPTKVNEHEYIVQLKRQLSIKKVEGQEDRYGKIFNLTQSEKDNFFTRANFELKKILAGG